MKEAFWGVLVVLLGLIGIVILQVFESITVTNDQTYYLLKEVTEASMLDSIDLGYYRTKGKIKIVEEKFVENIARRFAESASLNRDYNIVIHSIIEEPPKISLSIGTHIFSLQGDKFNIEQSINSIIEAKYNKNTIGEDIDEAPPDDTIENEDTCPICNSEDPNCTKVLECIPGNLRFVSWGNVTGTGQVCDVSELKNKSRTANYQVCECGKWTNASENVMSTLSNTPPNFIYTWHFVKQGPLRDIDEKISEAGIYGNCISEINIDCPNGVIQIEKGKSRQITPIYIPNNSVNRGLIWTSSNANILDVQYPSPDTIGSVGVSKATITGKKLGTATITVKSNNNKTDSCDVLVTDKLICTPIEMFVNSTAEGKSNIAIRELIYTISNPNIATMDKNTGVIKSNNNPTTINYTISALGYDTSEPCPIKIKQEEEPDTTPIGCTPGSISVKWDINNKWPNKTGPTLCPQDFEYLQKCNPTPPGPTVCSTSKESVYKIGTLYDNATYCGYTGTYQYPAKDNWDKTVSLNSSMYNGLESVNETTHKYTVTFSHRFDYEGWTTSVGPYTRGVNEVLKTYTISGKLLDRNSSTCKTNAKSNPFVTIINCPSGIVEGTSAVQLTADRFSAAQLVDSTAEWYISSGSSYLKLTNTNATSAKVQGIGKGTAEVKYRIKDKDGNWIYSLNSCKIDVYPKCSAISISGSSTINKGESEDYSASEPFGGESKWSTNNSNVLKITSDISTFRKSIQTIGKGVGTANITMTRRIDNCEKSKTITVKQSYKCPTIDGHRTEEYSVNTDYCYTSAKPASFSCSQTGTYKYMGWSRTYNKIMCFKTPTEASNGYGACIEPSYCNPWITGYVASLKHCYYLYRKEPQ